MQRPQQAQKLGRIKPSSAMALCVALLLCLTMAGLDSESKTKTKRRRPAPVSQSAGVRLQTPNPRTPVEHNNRGVELGMKGLWPDAIREHEKALAADPHNKEFRTNLSAAQLRWGDRLMGKKDYYNACNQYRGALYVDPNNHAAEAHLDEALRLLGNNLLDLAARQKMGEDYEVSGRFEDAIVEYRKVVKMSESGPAHAQLGYVLKKAGKIVDSFQELKIAVSKDWPADKKNELSTCHRELGDILKKYAYIARDNAQSPVALRRLLNAGIQYRRAATLNPGNGSAVQGLIEVSREAVAINPAFDNFLTLAAAYQLAGDFERARLEYENAWGADANHPALGKARRSYYLAVVSSPLASPAVLASTIEKIKRELDKQAGDAELQYIYGRALEAKGDRQAALTAYKQAAAINPYANPDLNPGISRLSGSQETTTSQDPGGQEKDTAAAPGSPAIATQVSKYSQVEDLMTGGQLDEAHSKLEAMVRKDPKDGRAWLLIGNIREKKGDLDQAVVAYRQSSYLDEKDADLALGQINLSRIQPMLTEADLAINEKNYVKAAASLRQAASIAPRLPVVYERLAVVLEKLGDRGEASRMRAKARQLDKSASRDASSKKTKAIPPDRGADENPREEAQEDQLDEVD